MGKLTPEGITTAIENFQMLVEIIKKGNESDLASLAEIYVEYAKTSNEAGLAGVFNLFFAICNEKVFNAFMDLVLNKLENFPDTVVDKALKAIQLTMQHDINGGIQVMPES